MRKKRGRDLFIKHIALRETWSHMSLIIGVVDYTLEQDDRAKAQIVMTETIQLRDERATEWQRY